jgi:hypothetical protein
MASTACGVRVKESSGQMEIGDTQAVIIQTLTARGYGTGNVIGLGGGRSRAPARA